jgi:zinc transport system substrate-binding protein
LSDVEGEIVDVLEGLPVREGEHEPQEDEDEEVEEHAEDEGIDPHVWLDPLLWSRAVQKVGGALARVDPDGADGYREREAAYVNEIDALDDEYEQGLGSCKRNLLVTAHTAFGYLAERYGLHEEAIAGISPEAEPDPKRMAELADLVEEEDVTTIFTESLVSPKVAESLARQVGVKTAVLDPLESEPEGGYAEGMRENLDALTKGLGCR